MINIKYLYSVYLSDYHPELVSGLRDNEVMRYEILKQVQDDNLQCSL